RDDHRRRGTAAARHQLLVAVENRVAQRAERRRLEADEEAQRRGEAGADRARARAEPQRSISIPSCAAETCSVCAPRVSSSRRRASRSAPSMAASLLAGSWWNSTRCLRSEEHTSELQSREK